VRPRGRPPSTRQVLSFEASETPLPEEVLLDTSFVVEALLVSQPLHAAAVDFLVRLATEDVRIRFSSMLELELAETAFQIALKENHPKDWKRFRHDGRARRRAGRLMSGVEEAWVSVLAYVDYVRFDVDDVIEEVPRLMRTYGLASYDAVHAATANARRARCSCGRNEARRSDVSQAATFRHSDQGTIPNAGASDRLLGGLRHEPAT
jgi:predicted nucleic acid-binding protein